MHEKRAHFLFDALLRSPTKGLNRIHEEKMRPCGRISTTMSLYSKMFGRILAERRVALMPQ
ncbi:MAG: hypothetical protein IJR99_15545, partial [Kiritimatiellae bacterium]|nr:hypothetical protein [Kiritimatiellia bacterium]